MTKPDRAAARSAVLALALLTACGRGCGEHEPPPPPEPLTVDTPRASCSRPDTQLCTEYLGFRADEAWVRSDCAAIPGAIYVEGSCPAEAAVLRCIRSEGERREQQDLYYAPRYSAARAEQSCVRRGGQPIVLAEGTGEAAGIGEPAGTGEVAGGGEAAGTGDGSGMGTGVGPGAGAETGTGLGAGAN